MKDLGLEYEQVLTEFVGANATHGTLSGPPDPEAPEVQLRIGVRAPERAPVERFTREIAPLVLTGPPSVTGFAGGRPAVEEVVAYWPALIDRRVVESEVRVEILERRRAGGTADRRREEKQTMTGSTKKENREQGGGSKQRSVRPSSRPPVRLQLRYLAHARSGDKGDTANVGLIALEPDYYPILVRQVTTARVARHFKGMVTGVERFELPT